LSQFQRFYHVDPRTPRQVGARDRHRSARIVRAIVAPPRTGKTVLLQNIAKAIPTINVKCFIVLLD
jgi:hypothetical protein